MLKKYKQSGKSLSAKQLQAINGGAADNQRGIFCNTQFDCPVWFCATAEDIVYACDNHSCELAACS